MDREELQIKLGNFRSALYYQAKTTPEHLAALILAGMLPKSDLKIGKYYFGTCRNASVAQWDGISFTYIRKKWGATFPEKINHPENDDGFDLFYPVSECEPKEEEKILEIPKIQDPLI